MDAALEKTYRLRGFGCCFLGAALRAGTRLLRNSLTAQRGVRISSENATSR
jgi:hypothetical protein